MEKKTKILFIHHGTGIGGAPMSLLNLVNKLDHKKYQSKVAFVRGGVAEQLFRDQGIITEVLNSSNVWFAHNESGRIQWRYLYRYFMVMVHWMHTAYYVAPRYLLKQDADIVHVNSHVLTSWAFAAKKLGMKVVMHNREAVAGGYFGIRRSILRKLIERSCDRIIHISVDNMRRLGIINHASVVYNFVEIPGKYRHSMESQSDRRKILFLGGMAPFKGYEVVAACLKYLNEHITVQFAGSVGRFSTETLKDRIKNFVKLTLFRKRYGLLKSIFKARNAEIVGMTVNVLSVVDACDILITPFTIAHFSRPAIEAFAYGKPVIGSDVEGMDEIIDHGVNGLLVEKNNPKALADAINYLCENPEVARQMGQNARKKAVELFSPEVNTRKVEAIYDELIG